MYQFHSELYTYNPLKGKCSHDCSYCFMKSMRARFKQNATLRLDPQELNAKLGKNRFIFIGSSTDVFASDVPHEFITAIFDHAYDFPDNEYMLQSKNPARFLEFSAHKLFDERKAKLVLCTTIESNIDYPDISSAPVIAERVEVMRKLFGMGYKTMVTVEPIMKFTDAAVFANMLASVVPIQVNIGANSSRAVKLPEPTKAEVNALISELKARGITVHLKDNLDRLLK